MAVQQADVAPHGPATVVVLQSVRPEDAEAYRAWQERTDQKAAHFPGFLGAEVTPPSGIQTDWLIVYRFDTEEQLQGWLDSREFAAQMQEGQTYFASPPRQLTASSPRTPATDAVSVVIRHHVRPGREAAYATWQQEMAVAEQKAPGYLGTELIPPGPGAQPVWSAILRFDTGEHLEAWMSSKARQDLVQRGKSIYQDFDATRVRAGFDGWFQFGQDGGLVEVPPVWKQALTVLLGLYPTVMVLSLLVTKHLDWGLPQVILLGNILSTVTLSWAVMPGVNRLFQFWLRPAGSRHTTIDVRGAAIIAVTLLVLMVIFQLVSPYLP